MGSQRSLSVNLGAGAAYYVAVQSYNSGGNSGYSNIEYFIIGTPATSPSVTTGSATSVTTSSATLNGTVNPNGTSTTYYFQYGTTTGYGSTTTSKNAGSGSSNVSVSESITGLDCNTTYHYRLVGVNSQGTSYGEDQTFKTSLCPVSKPTVTTGSATSVGTSSATLNGTVNPNGATATYYFRYGTTQNYGMTTTITSVGSGNDAVSASASITELSDNTIYYFRLVGVNSAGPSYGQEDRSFVTNSDNLPAP